MNQEAINGSCIYTGNNAKIQILNSNFINNTATNNTKIQDTSNYFKSRGGAITLGSGSGIIKNCTFINNKASYGGAISINSGNVTDIEDCTFINNHGSIHAGAIHCFGKITIKNSEFTNNSALTKAGAIISTGTLDEITIENCHFNNNYLNETYNKNKAYSIGGVLSAHGQSSYWIVKNTKFTNNSAGYGGVMYCTNGINSVEFTNNTCINNSATNGGVILLSSKNMIAHITNTQFKNNHAKNDGGVIALNSSDIQLTITNTIFKNNSATNGGAISIPMYEHTTINNVTFTENNAEDKGGALYINDSQYLKLFRSRLDQNNANLGSAIYFNNLNTTTQDQNDIEIRSNSICYNTNYSIYSTVKNTVNAKYNWWGSNEGNNTANENVDATSPFVILFSLNKTGWTPGESVKFEANIALCNMSNENVAGLCDCVIYLTPQEITITTEYADKTQIQTYELYKKLTITIPENVTSVTLKLDDQEITYKPGDLRQSYIRLTATKINKTQTKIRAEIIDGFNKEITGGKCIFKINGISQGKALNITKSDLTLFVNNTSNKPRTYIITFVYGTGSDFNFTECRQNITITVEGNNANTKEQESVYWDDTNNTAYVTERTEC